MGSDNPNGRIPTPAWTWPTGASLASTNGNHTVRYEPFYADHPGPGVVQVHQAAIDKLRTDRNIFERDAEEWLTKCRDALRDRDELLAAVTVLMNHMAECDAQGCQCDRGPAWESVKGTVARLKAGK